MKHAIFFVLGVLLFLPLGVFAQEDMSLSVEPRNPAPFERVTVALVSYSFDVNTAMVTWSTNGKTLFSGVGKKTIALTAGDIGQEIPLGVQVTLIDGSSVTQQITISPQSVDLVYEAKESYVPPFYGGRSLPGEGSRIQVTAMPVIAEGGKKVASNDLSYSWYVNDTYFDKASGLGKSSLLASLDYLRESTDIRVVVRSPRGNVAEKEVSVFPHDVMPLLYPYDELLGANFSKTFIRRLELSKDVTLSLQPFYLSTKGLESTASYAWYVDGLPVTPQEKTILSLRPKENSTGVRALTVTAEQTKRRLQKAEAYLQVVFDTRN